VHSSEGKERVANLNRLGGTPEELNRAFHQAHTDLQRAKDDLRNAERTTQVRYICPSHRMSTDAAPKRLKTALMDRFNRWKKFRRFISSRARIAFSYNLIERNYRGSLIIDPVRKVLDTKVEPDITKTSAQGRQTKTLSGGEKSFSTICLLLSLWEAMGSPIRALDEFDVFMDSVNRDVSVRMLIKAARRSVGRQFILITPQAMDNIVPDEDVRIIRLGDPERRQTTLPFGR
jgi:structural maintenance of chromosomes protein 6